MATLRVVTQLGRAPAAPASAGFGTDGATIGRSPDCTLVLHDPARHISREQARVDFSNGSFVITCLGSPGASIVVNGAEVPSGQTAVLRGGDSIVIADYELRFDLEAPAGSATTGADRGRPADAAIPDDFDPFSEPLAEPPASVRPAAPSRRPADTGASAGAAPAGDDDPFAFTPKGPRDREAGEPPAPDGRHSARPGGPDGSKDTTPSGRDPLGLGLSSGTGEAAPGAPSESIDELFGLRGASSDPLGLSQPSSQPNTSTSTDPLAAFGTEPRLSSAPVPDHVPELGGAFRLPEPIPPTDFGLEAGAAKPPQTEPTSPATQSGSPAAGAPSSARAGAAEPPEAPLLRPEEVRSIAEHAMDARPSAFEVPSNPPPTDLLNRLNQAQRDALRGLDGSRSPGAAGAPPVKAADPQAEQAVFELLKSLLLGLGLTELPRSPLASGGSAGPTTLSPELMRRIGELLKVSTQGTLDLLQVRATVKRELKADVTVIASSENNPLKFSPDAQAALAHLLSNRSVRGFMEPVPALRDAYDDLLAHQVGFVAGMRAAMQGLIARFDPAELEQRLTRRTVLDSMLPMTRRSRLWELFQEMYDEISREAEDDFEKLFGREFLRAYEEQIARLNETKR